MKNILRLISITVFSIACQQPTSITGSYGQTDWDSNGVINGSQLLQELHGKDSLQTIVRGKITAACQAKGCWLNMDIVGQDMLVKFKNYGFFVPKNCANYTAVVSGWAYIDTITVSQQKEIAKDSEASPAEIASVTEPKVELQFIADGVIIE